MATRSAIPGTKTGVTDSLSVAEFNDLPGGIIGKTAVTSDQSSITTLVDLTGLTLTLTPAASRILRIGFQLRFADTNTGEEIQVLLMKDGSQLQRFDFPVSPRTASEVTSVSGWCYDDSPTNASHTYKLQAGTSGSSTGTYTLKASSTTPAQFCIWDEGPTF